MSRFPRDRNDPQRRPKPRPREGFSPYSSPLRNDPLRRDPQREGQFRDPLRDPQFRDPLQRDPLQRDPQRRDGYRDRDPQNRDFRERRPQRQPAHRPPRRPRGPSYIEPSEPASGKQRRVMLKAAAWRLARLVHSRPAELMASQDLRGVLQRAFPRPMRGDGHGEAARLVAKILRLRDKESAREAE